MERAFWKEGVVYQIYPISFKDSDGDGHGDLRGILEKLDYLQGLGVTMLWLGPVCKSPMEDYGYDVSDYYEINEPFGTMEDFEELLREVHARGMKLFMDLVINHTSDQHAWFQQASSSREHPRRSYYIWKDGVAGAEPNNWMSFSEESAWKLDEQTGQYYLRIFDVTQPDLNWEHAPMRHEMYEMIRYWLDKGIDGFRLDAINILSKEPGFPDAPAEDPHPRGQRYFKNGPKVHDYLQELHTEVFSRYENIVTVGEAPSISMEEAVRYSAPERKELSMVLLMEMIGMDVERGNPWKVRSWRLQELKDIVNRWSKEVFGKGWYGTYLSNHDHPRMLPRYGADGELRELSGKMLATFLHTIPGTPFMYQGEELGMTNVKFSSIQDYRDKNTLGFYKRMVEEEGASEQEVLDMIQARSRDSARTPMQWSAEAQAGFTSGTPWIPVNDNYKDINSEESMKRPDSLFHYYRRLIALRKEQPVLAYGNFNMLLEDEEHIMCYTRTYKEKTWLVLLNFADHEVTTRWPEGWKRDSGQAVAVLGNYEGLPAVEERGLLKLKPFEAVIVEGETRAFR
ncbi:MalL [Paenibacillus algicola]|uniref:MalL n=1 Tax=Paenibacillus algicola TaxID=2565926 RepID=A0A4V1G3R3_9BACL|nr:alpha-glucosidase [Paenibacillus algicola]QCT02094.1 MalL [Paenibacillus algicola]